MSMGAKSTAQDRVEEPSALRNFPFEKEDIKKNKISQMQLLVLILFS